MGTESFLWVKYGRGVLLTTHPLLVRRSWKSRAIPLPTLWATTGPVTVLLYLYIKQKLNEEISSVQNFSNITFGFYSKLWILWCVLIFSRITKSICLKKDKIFVWGESWIPLRFRAAFLIWDISWNCKFSTTVTSDFAVQYRVIHKSLRDFRTRLRNNQDRHGTKEHINR